MKVETRRDLKFFTTVLKRRKVFHCVRVAQVVANVFDRVEILLFVTVSSTANRAIVRSRALFRQAQENDWAHLCDAHHAQDGEHDDKD